MTKKGTASSAVTARLSPDCRREARGAGTLEKTKPLPPQGEGAEWLQIVTFGLVCQEQMLRCRMKMA